MRLTPRQDIFYPLFTRSAEHLRDGSRLLCELLAAAPADRVALAQALRDAEHATDESTHEILRTVNSTFVTPFDREDIYRLASALDDVMDEMEAAADLIVLYALEDLPPEFAEIGEVLSQSAAITADAMPRLRTMSELSTYWIEINRLENVADQAHRALLARLFTGEFDAFTVMKVKDVAEALEAAADAFEKVAHTIESIAVKES